MNIEDVANKTLFFFGAGASAEADCKTSSEMLEDLLSKIEREGNPDEIEIYCFILSCIEYQKSWRNLKSKQQDFITNIEEFVFLLRKIIYRDHLLPHPLVGNWSEKILKFEYKNGDIFKSLLSKLEYSYLPSWLAFDSSKQSKLLTPLKQFFVDTTDKNFIFDIVTINYDLLLENFLNNSSETVVNDGFDSNQWLDSFEAPSEGNKYRINYYKLHGSLNWTRDEDSGQVTKKESPSGSSSAPLLIFGQETKMLSIEPFLSLTSRFKELLHERDYIIVIGYSFFDTYINNLILEAVNKYPEKKLIVVSPFNGMADESHISKELAAKIKRIQESDINSNMYNIKQISPDKIKILKMKASKFYSEYFGKQGSKLSKLIEELSKPDEPFTIPTSI